MIQSKPAPKRRSRGRVMKAWADVGSHGHIFEFEAGPVADRGYRHLLHVFSQRVTPDLVPVEIRMLPDGD